MLKKELISYSPKRDLFSINLESSNESPENTFIKINNWIYSVVNFFWL